MSPTIASTAVELARLARGVGVRVELVDLERALSGLSPEELAGVPESYAHALADAAAAGIDLNDPNLDEIVFEGTAEEAIRFLGDGDGTQRCGSSG